MPLTVHGHCALSLDTILLYAQAIHSPVYEDDVRSAKCFIRELLSISCIPSDHIYCIIDAQLQSKRSNAVLPIYTLYNNYLVTFTFNKGSRTFLLLAASTLT